MSGRPRRSRRWLAAALPPLALLSGCLTTDLWSDYAWPDPAVTEQLVDQRDEKAGGTLLASEPVLENGLWWTDGADPATPRWWLYPRGWDGEEAEVAAALLADPGLCRVEGAAIDARRRDVVEYGAENDTWLELQLRVDDEAIGGPVHVMQVAPAASRALAKPRDETLLAVELDARVPLVHRSDPCQPVSLDLRRFVGARSAVQTVGWVLVDAIGRPVPAVGSDQQQPVELRDEHAPLADHLAALRELSLLVRVRHGSQSTILRLRPDRAWLASRLQRYGERCVHRSRWFLQSGPRPFAALPSVGAAPIATTLHLREQRYQRWFHPSILDDGLLAKIVLTPFTVALDVLFGPQARDFVRWISGRKSAPSDAPRRGS